MVFSEHTEVIPSTQQLVIHNTNITQADDRAGIAYEKGIPTHLVLRSTTTSEHMISVELSPMMVIGRKASMRDYEVTIDLTDFNATKSGVSRYHAVLLALDNHIYLKDIDSLNGSLLNGKRMTPSKEYIIMDRDIVAFGNLEVRIEFVYA